MLVGKDSTYVSTLVRHGVALPVTGQTDQFSTEGGVPNRHKLSAPIYEGHMPEAEIPYGPFNTYLGELVVDCPATSDRTGGIPLVVEYDIDASRLIRVKCWFKDDPSVGGEITLSTKSLPRDKTHLIERTERTVNEAGERIGPEEKARVNRKRQAILDLCEQHAASASDDLRKQIISTGNELLEMVRSIEQRLKLK